MGSGKSTVGRQVAAGLDFEFVDTDEMIVAEAGKDIPEIFSAHGEEHFRDLETAILRSLLDRAGLVISTGGGIILRPENREMLGDLGFIVWLDAAEDTIAERVSRNENRPLVRTGNPLETVRRLLRERLPLYQSTSNLAVRTDDLSVDEITHGIVDSARLYFSGGAA